MHITAASTQNATTHVVVIHALVTMVLPVTGSYVMVSISSIISSNVTGKLCQLKLKIFVSVPMISILCIGKIRMLENSFH